MVIETEELHIFENLKLSTPPRVESGRQAGKLEKLTRLPDIHLGLRYRNFLFYRKGITKNEKIIKSHEYGPAGASVSKWLLG